MAGQLRLTTRQFDQAWRRRLHDAGHRRGDVCHQPMALQQASVQSDQGLRADLRWVKKLKQRKTGILSSSGVARSGGATTICRTLNLVHRNGYAGLVLDDDLLAPDLSHSLSKRPRENIGHAARGRRHDQCNRLVGIALAMGAYRSHTQPNSRRQRALPFLHCTPLRRTKRSAARSKLHGSKLTAHLDSLNT
jgi:hypothetical protein